MNHFLKFVFTGLIIVFATSMQAQEIWTLEKCVQYAQQNNLSMKQSAIAIQNAKLTEKGNLKARLPTLNGNFGADLRSGRSIDVTTNTFNTSTIGTNSYSLSSNFLLYNGGRIKNAIKQSEFDIAQAEANAEQTSYDLALNVAAAYLSILMAEEQLENSNKRIEQTRNQLEQVNKLIKAGSRPANDRLDIQANIAMDEQDIVNKENAIEIAYLNLKQLLLLEPDFNLKVERPEISIPQSDGIDFQFNDVYNAAVTRQPSVKAGEYALESAALGIDIAAAGTKPRISLFANMSTFFSTRAERISDFTSQPFVQEVDVSSTLLNETVFLTSEREVPIWEKTPYFNQINENFGQTIGASVSIPIYNNHQARIGMERAELNIIQTQLNNRQIKEQLKSDVQRAIADAKAAGKALEASEKTAEARKVAFENTQKKFDLGAINSFELTTSKNSLDQAEVNLILAKYDYLFKLKIVDYYLGNDMQLN